MAPEPESALRLMRRAFHSLALNVLATAFACGANLGASVDARLPQVPRLAAPSSGLSSAPPPAKNAARARPLPSVAAREVSAPGAAQALQSTPSNAEARRLDVVFDGLAYPKTRRDDAIVDDYFGTEVPDPYRWLENPHSRETKTWVTAQNRLAKTTIRRIPEHAALAERLDELYYYPTVGRPQKIGRYWTYSENKGQGQDVIYTARALGGPRQVLLNPDRLPNGGTLEEKTFSDDGRHMAYAISHAGSDWKEWRIRDVATGKDLPEVLKWTDCAGVSWAPDGKGFYYTRYPRPKAGEILTGIKDNQKVYYHRLGQKQKDDLLIYERPDQPRWHFETEIAEDKRHLLLYQYEDTAPQSRVWIKDLATPGAPFKPLFDRFDAEYMIVGSEGSTLFVQTTKDAPRGKLVRVDLGNPAPERWKTIIPEAADRHEALEKIMRIGKRFVAVWKTKARHALRVYGPRGGLKHEVALPEMGSVSDLAPLSRREKIKAFFTFSSYTRPETVFRLNVATGKTSVYRRPKAPVDPARFEVKQVFYRSKDGTDIPMFIIHKKGLRLDGMNPTYLYGYGAFGLAQTPSYSGAEIAWMERGGVYAVANLRGGGEFGYDWHDAGRRENKQTMIDDFIAAAEYLIREKYTSTPRLAIGGSSNGGLLVAAALTQRPDLFGAAVPEVGVLDLLRFQLFTIGYLWRHEYGTSESVVDFDTLIKYSPLHNVRPGTRYPATLVMTGEHDDRVVPAHSHKFTAALQAAQAGPAPILAHIERDAGHGTWGVDTIADKWAFLLKALGVSQPAES